MKRGKLLEQSGSEFYVTPLVFDLEENIYFSIGEICVAHVPLFHVGMLLLFLFFLFTPLLSNHTHQATKMQATTHKVIKKIVGPHFWN